MQELLGNQLVIILVALIVIIFGFLAMLSKWYKKPDQGKVLVRTGFGGVRISQKGMFSVPIIHKLEIMDISLKSVISSRYGKEGLVCKDNLRADIKVAFFVKVNSVEKDIKEVAQSVGCVRASSKEALEQLFDAKFSDALKTVGKQFDFVELYESREDFKRKIIEVIGTDLNGYRLEDAAIDYLEQTPVTSLDENNILDAEGIKKITELTAAQKMLSNKILRNEEKVIKQQDVEAQEAILEMEKHLAGTQEKQKREIANVKARESAEISRVNEENRLIAEKARIATEEELMIAEENKLREVIVAEKNKERISAIETERVERERLLELTDRERVVTLAQIDKEKAIEEEKKKIQEVIRERIVIEKSVVEEEEKIKDTKAIAEADREKKVAITRAEKEAEEKLVQEIKAAEAAEEAAHFNAKRMIIDSEAEQVASTKKAEAIKVLAEAEASKKAAEGIAEAQVMEAKAEALEKQGESEASVLEAKFIAEAKGIELKSHAQAEANTKIGEAHANVERLKGLAEAKVIEVHAEAEEKKGLAEAHVEAEKYKTEADGISQKAEAMKLLDGVGKEHEEFKLRLDKDTQIELAQISIQKDIAGAQADVLSAALQKANIDIVGGDHVFFDKITNAITKGKTFDRMIENSAVYSEVKEQLLDSENGNLMDKIKDILAGSSLKSDDVKNLSISALIYKLIKDTSDEGRIGSLEQMLQLAKSAGVDQKTLASLGIMPN